MVCEIDIGTNDRAIEDFFRAGMDCSKTERVTPLKRLDELKKGVVLLFPGQEDNCGNHGINYTELRVKETVPLTTGKIEVAGIAVLGRYIIKGRGYNGEIENKLSPYKNTSIGLREEGHKKEISPSDIEAREVFIIES